MCGCKFEFIEREQTFDLLLVSAKLREFIYLVVVLEVELRRQRLGRDIVVC
jgi:hypothetical protein